MENKEYTFKGTVMNGFLMLFVNLAVLILSIVGIVYSIISLDESNGACGGWLLGGCILLLIINIMMWCGLMMLEPNEAKVTTWFGKYSGTFAQRCILIIGPMLIDDVAHQPIIRRRLHAKSPTMPDTHQPYKGMPESLHHGNDFIHVANLHTFSETNS